MSDSIKFGLVGVGRMGRHHARVLSTINEAEFVGVYDQDESRVKDVCEEWGGSLCSNISELVSCGIDAAVVATPTDTHEPIAGELLSQGIHCLIEKPLAPDTVTSQKIKECARSSGSLLQVGHVVRYDPVMRAISQLRINPRFIEMSRVSPFTFRSVDVGVVLDMMIHDIDLLTMLLGSEPAEIQANSISVFGDPEDVCNARLTFAKCELDYRPVANITASRLAMKSERKIRILSEDAYVSADFISRKGTVVRKKENEVALAEVRERLRGGEDLSDIDYLNLISVEELTIQDGDPLTLQVLDFIKSIKEGQRPAVDADAGMSAVKTAERIVKIASAHSGKLAGPV